jgi:hypothetical protein
MRKYQCRMPGIGMNEAGEVLVTEFPCHVLGDKSSEGETKKRKKGGL